MSARFTAITHRLTTTNSLPTGTAYTILGWTKIVTSTSSGTYQIMWVVYNGSRFIWVETNGMVLEMSTSGTTSGAGDVGSLRTLTTNTWYRVALVVNGTTQRVYHGTETGTLTQGGTGTLPPNQFIPAGISFGGDANGAYLRGDLANVQVYNAALTADELEMEFTQFQPLRTDGMVQWYPFVSDLVGYSGNGETTTNNGANPSVSDSPPVRWARSRGPRVTITAPPTTDAAAETANVGMAAQDANALTEVPPTGLGPDPVDLSTQGTVRTANSDATIVSQINASAAGDTVTIATGTYGYLTVTKSIPTGFIRVVPAAGATVTCAGIDLSSAQGIDVRGINTTGTSNYNNWWQNSTRCRWRGGTHTMSSSTMVAFTVRQGCSDIVIEDVTVNDASISFIAQGFSETGRSTNITFQRFRSNNVAQDHVFLSRGDDITVQDFEMFGHTDTSEHSDGIQIVGAKDVMIRRGHIWNTRAFRDAATDLNDHGIIVNYDPAETPEGRVPENITVENVLIHDMTSHGITVAGVLGMTIRNCTAYDNGPGGTSEGLAVDADAGNSITGLVVANNIFNKWTNVGITPTTNTHNFVADGSGPTGTSLLTGSPGFIDNTTALALDYGITSGSQNAASGSLANSTTYDMNSVVRSGSAASRGAIEPVAITVATATEATLPVTAQGVSAGLAAAGSLAALSVTAEASTSAVTVLAGVATVGVSAEQPNAALSTTAAAATVDLVADAASAVTVSTTNAQAQLAAVAFTTSDASPSTTATSDVAVVTTTTESGVPNVGTASEVAAFALPAHQASTAINQSATADVANVGIVAEQLISVIQAIAGLAAVGFDAPVAITALAPSSGNAAVALDANPVAGNTSGSAELAQVALPALDGSPSLAIPATESTIGATANQASSVADEVVVADAANVPVVAETPFPSVEVSAEGAPVALSALPSTPSVTASAEVAQISAVASPATSEVRPEAGSALPGLTAHDGDALSDAEWIAHATAADLDVQALTSTPQIRASAQIATVGVTADSPVPQVSADATPATVSTDTYNPTLLATSTANTATLTVAAVDAVGVGADDVVANAQTATIGVAAETATIIGSALAVPAVLAVDAQTADTDSVAETSALAGTATIGVTGYLAAAALAVTSDVATVETSGGAPSSAVEAGVDTAQVGVDGIAGDCLIAPNADLADLAITGRDAEAITEPIVYATAGIAEVGVTSSVGSGSLAPTSNSAAVGITAANGTTAVRASTGIAVFSVDSLDSLATYGKIVTPDVAEIGFTGQTVNADLTSQAAAALWLMLALIPEAEVPAMYGAIVAMLRPRPSIVSTTHSNRTLTGRSYGALIISRTHRVPTITGLEGK